eukprot:5376296-Amphidinium_carterae.1
MMDKEGEHPLDASGPQGGSMQSHLKAWFSGLSRLSMHSLTSMCCSGVSVEEAEHVVCASDDGPGEYPLNARGLQGGAASESSDRPWTLNTVEYPTIPSYGEARLLPPTAVEVNAWTTIVVGSQEYVIGRKLGGGGFGDVHEARLVESHTDPSRTLAVKLAGFI